MGIIRNKERLAAHIKMTSICAIYFTLNVRRLCFQLSTSFIQLSSLRLMSQSDGLVRAIASNVIIQCDNNNGRVLTAFRQHRVSKNSHISKNAFTLAQADQWDEVLPQIVHVEWWTVSMSENTSCMDCLMTYLFTWCFTSIIRDSI